MWGQARGGDGFEGQRKITKTLCVFILTRQAGDELGLFPRSYTRLWPEGL